MPIRITCPSCSAVLSVRDENAGRAVRCPKCDGVIPVPVPAPPPEPPPEPAAPPPPPARSDFDDLGDDDDRPRRPAKSPARKPAPAARSDFDDLDDDDDDRPRRRPSKPRGGMGDYLTFRKMIVPVVIQIIFWFLALIVLGGAAAFAAYQLSIGRMQNVAVGAVALFIGAPLYILLIRMYCEVLIVIFRMNDTLTDIRNALERRND